MVLLFLLSVLAAAVVVWMVCVVLAAMVGWSRAEGHATQQWAHHFQRGRRVLVVGLGDSAAEVAAAAGRAGAEVQLRRLDIPARKHGGPRGILQHVGEYDVVVALGFLGACAEGVSKSLFGHLCGLVTAGGVLLVRDLAVLPANPGIALLRCLLPRFLLGSCFWDAGLQGLAHDLVAWLPPDMNVGARLCVGAQHEELTIHKGLMAPHAAVERLRRLYGESSMMYCTSAEANRIGAPEKQIRFFLAVPKGMRPSGSNEIGYVAYVEHVVMGARLRLVLMDPACAAADREATVRAFLAECGAVGARALFVCVTADFVEPLRSFGFHATMLGAELGIPLAQYRLSKERRRYLRLAPAKGLECHGDCYDPAELEALNAAWLGSKASGAEVMIWTWPPSLPRSDAGGEGGARVDEVRRLFTYQDGRLVGFLCAEPYYRGDGSGEVLGYGLNTIRFLPRLSPPWISDVTVATLIESLQTEAKADFLAFGFSPCSEVRACPGDLPWLRRLLQLMWDANMEDVYSIQGLARKKAHHCAGQGVRLHDRFFAGLPEHGVRDTVRFIYLLLNDCLWKVPEMLNVLVRRAVAGMLSGVR